MKRVEFKNRIGLTIVGNMFFPEDFDETKQYPAISFTHPAGGVKEQTAGKYAEALSKYGYITMAYDATYQGESEGEPRNLEDPASRVEDVRACMDYFTTLPFVDKNRLGAAGVCAGGAYPIKAAQTDKRIKVVAGVVPSDIGPIFRNGWFNTQTPEELNAFLEKVSAQRTAEANGAEPLLTGWVPDEDDENLPQEMRSGWEYYRTPLAGHPRSINRFPFVSFDRVIEFTAFDHVDTLLPQPSLFITGSNAGTRWVTEWGYNRAMEPKELLVVEGANHFDMYHKEPYFTQALEKMAEFFGKYL